MSHISNDEEYNSSMENKKVFAQGWCFYKIFWIFLIGSIFGAYWEECLYIVKNFFITGLLEWSPRRGVLYGPISPVYGVGAVIMIFFLKNPKEKWYTLYLKGALIGGAVEYIVSFLQETFVGTTSWNYSDKFLSIGGRTAGIYMFFWGFLGLLLIKVIYPFISRQIEKIPMKVGNILTNILCVILSIDCFISWTAILRWNLRVHEIKPLTFVGEMYDHVFTNDYMQKHFPNMEMVEK